MRYAVAREQHANPHGRQSYINPPAKQQSQAYKQFASPIDNGTRGGFDVHIYHLQTDPSEVAFATALWERIRREFPELRTYRVWDRPVGPHPVAMFEVNLFTPEVRRRGLPDSSQADQQPAIRSVYTMAGDQ